MKHEAIWKCSSDFPVIRMCKALELTQSGYYQWFHAHKRRNEKREKERELIDKVTTLFVDTYKTYGYRRMYQTLLSKGIEISEYKVAQIMHENGLYPETTKKYKPYPKQKADSRYSDNEICQEFAFDESNQCWAGDITYIKTIIGWVYLAVVIDLFNREVIGYSISKKANTELVKRAFGNALARKGNVAGLIFHSDYTEEKTMPKVYCDHCYCL